jgi:RNA polymerase sigma factor (sigma-70 family)
MHSSPSATERSATTTTTTSTTQWRVLVAILLTLAAPQSSEALASRVASNRKSLQSTKLLLQDIGSSTSTPAPIPATWQETQQSTNLLRRTKTNPLFSHHDEDDDDDDVDYEDLEFEVHDFQELQRSTGSEILNDELQQQIDSASPNANRFLDALVSDASYLEKVAMSSIPEQLPRPAVYALSQSRNNNNNKYKNRSSKLNFSTIPRVTHEEEIELGKMIQKGVRVHKLRSDFEERNGREITRREWVEISGLESPKELRRVVSDYRKAKQLLVTANMGLVHAVVKQQYNSGRTSSSTTSNTVSKEELIQEGSLGLLRAAELFDPSRGLRFSTYATIWIKGMLHNSNLVETIKLPARERTKFNKIAKAHAELMNANGGSREPSVEELANHLGMNTADVILTQRKMNQAQNVLSLDYEYRTQSRSGSETGSQNRLENDPALRADMDLAEQTQMHADVVAAMARNLDAREARLLRLRYGLADGKCRSLSECADAMGLSQTRVQQLAKKCLQKMREAADAESLEEYLLTIA